MAQKRKDTSILLIGHQQEKLCGSKLPSNREILQHYFYLVKTKKETSRRAIIDVVRKVAVFWNYAKIPIKLERNSVAKLDRLVNEYRSISKNIRNKKSINQAVKEIDFVSKLDDLFDIAHASEINNLEKDILDFLSAQRQEGR